MQVNSTNSVTGTSNSQSLSVLPEQSLNQKDFLKLLVAQLSSQDPMNPVSSTDFSAQMAQFSTLQTTQTMQANLAGLESGQAVLQASGLLGRTVLVKSAQGMTDTGVVSAVGIEEGTPSIIVNGQAYTLGDVLSVSLAQPQP